MAKPPAGARKQAKVALRAQTTAPKPAKPTRAACRAADAIRARGGVVGAEFAQIPIAERAAQLGTYRDRVQSICADEQAPLAPAERSHDVVLAAARQMEKALGRLAAEVEKPPRSVKRRSTRPAAG